MRKCFQAANQQVALEKMKQSSVNQQTKAWRLHYEMTFNTRLNHPAVDYGILLIVFRHGVASYLRRCERERCWWTPKRTTRLDFLHENFPSIECQVRMMNHFDDKKDQGIAINTSSEWLSIRINGFIDNSIDRRSNNINTRRGKMHTSNSTRISSIEL